MENYQLPKEFAEKWIAALRSGKYHQGYGCLLDGHNGYCCLGIAATISGYDDDLLLGEKILNESFSKIPYLLKGSGNSMYPSFNPFVDKVASMNDAGKSFDKIADWIEENVEFI